MNRDTVNCIAKALPGAEWSDPWGGGHDCWKVGGKIFALVGTTNGALSVKTDGVDTAEALIATGIAQHAPYLHRSWVLLPLDAPEDEIRHRIEASYRLIRAGLPKKVQRSLG